MHRVRQLQSHVIVVLECIVLLPLEVPLPRSMRFVTLNDDHIGATLLLAQFSLHRPLVPMSRPFLHEFLSPQQYRPKSISATTSRLIQPVRIKTSLLACAVGDNLQVNFYPCRGREPFTSQHLCRRLHFRHILR